MQVTNKLELVKQEDLTVFNDEDFFEQFAIEPIDEQEILTTKQGIEKEVIDICQNLGSFYDNLNLQRISSDKLKDFLCKNGLKTKKDIHLYLLYRDSSMFVEDEVLYSLHKILSSFYRIKKSVSDDLSDKSVGLIDGNKIFGYSLRYVFGYCHYKLHKGYLTKKLLDDHECLKKGCPLLEKFEDREFWINREEIKRLKKLDKQKKVVEEIRLLEYKSTAESYVKERGYNLKVVRVGKEKSDSYLVYFVTDINKNEEVKYYDVAKFLKDTYHENFWMRKISKPNGGYATIKDIKYLR